MLYVPFSIPYAAISLVSDYHHVKRVDPRFGVGLVPHSIEFEVNSDLCTIVVGDPIGLRSLEDGVQALASDPRLTPTTCLLLDMRTCRSVPSASDSRSLAWALASSMGARRTAIIVASMVHFGLANMISTLANLDGGQVRAFQEMEKAANWLKRIE
jgi:hypothetical protein